MSPFILSSMVYLLFLHQLSCGSSIEFDREFVGVNFSPYVKNTDNQTSHSCLQNYTIQELKAMLQVVATKFSRVSTDTVGAWNVEYSPQDTYYNSSCIIARTAEVAALINKDANHKTLSVLIGVMSFNDNSTDGINRTFTEVSVALEAVEIANRIYPGTVEGLQLCVDIRAVTDTKLASVALQWLTLILSRTEAKNLMIGVYVVVKDFEIFYLPEFTRGGYFDFQGPQVKIIEAVEFLNIKAKNTDKLSFLGPIKAFAHFTRPIVKYGPLAPAVFPNLEVMETSGWPSSGNHSFHNVESMKAYWSMFNDFATINKKYTIWLDEAFDNPYKRNMEQDFSSYVWWKLSNNTLVNDKTAYIGKIFEENKHSRTGPESIPNLPAYVGLGLVLTFIVTMRLAVSVKYFYRKINAPKQVLSYDEINAFELGVAQYGQFDCESAMKKPYNKELEISKDKLEIHWDQLLGSGQFGCVYKALLKTEPPKEVALKTTKTGCPSTTLKGLLSEIKILSHLGKHPNIVSICGAYTSELKKGKLYVALELCEMGSLKRHLMRLYTTKMANEEVQVGIYSCINKEALLRWSYEIASGMEYIGYKGVIHADLATRNVLLSNEGTAKIADFGLSRRLYEYSEYVKKGQEPLPWRWMAIESLKMSQFSCQSDVWSFGVTLWEIFSLGAEPHPGYSYNARFIESVEIGTAKLKRPSEATSEMYQIMLDCWHLRPDLRPSFNDLKTRILELRGTDYSPVAIHEVTS